MKQRFSGENCHKDPSQNHNVKFIFCTIQGLAKSTCRKLNRFVLSTLFLKQMSLWSQLWWHMPIITTFGSLRQEGCHSLGQSGLQNETQSKTLGDPHTTPPPPALNTHTHQDRHTDSPQVPNKEKRNTSVLLTKQMAQLTCVSGGKSPAACLT